MITGIKVHKISDVITYQGMISLTYDNNKRLTRIYSTDASDSSEHAAYADVPEHADDAYDEAEPESAPAAEQQQQHAQQYKPQPGTYQIRSIIQLK